MEALYSLWTFPAIVFAALLIAWGAECGQFYISQGLALAVLAWVQTLPEFAVEATIAFEAAKNPEQLHLVTANFTGSLRLFVGFGWPMIYFTALFFSGEPVHQKGRGFRRIVMEDENAFTVLGLLPAILYFVWIYLKGTLTMADGLVLGSIYGVYMWFLSKLPPQAAEGIEDLGRVPRWVMQRSKAQSIAAIAALFFAGALILWFCAHPFLHSMLALSVSLGISQFVFVQWVAPFLSEFPETLSVFRWAQQVKKAPMALTNFVSSSMNQWTILTGMVPFIYSLGLGHAGVIPFDEHQKVEILLTIVQSYLGFVFLVSMDFSLIEAVGLFALWFAQFIFPSVREEIIWVYGGWAALETLRLVQNFHERNAFRVFSRMCRELFFKKS